MQSIKFVCLGFFVPLENHSLIWRHHHYRFDLCSAPYVQWAVRVLKHATPITVTRGVRLLWSSPICRDTHTYCREFGYGAVTTCFYDLGPSRLGFEHLTLHLRGELSSQLCHHCGQNIKRKNMYEQDFLHKFKYILLIQKRSLQLVLEKIGKTSTLT